MSVRPSPGVVTRQCIVRQTGEWTDTHTDWQTDKLQLYLMGNFETIKPMVVSEVHKITSQKKQRNTWKFTYTFKLALRDRYVNSCELTLGCNEIYSTGNKFKI